jgi:hypothetical protein
LYTAEAVVMMVYIREAHPAARGETAVAPSKQIRDVVCRQPRTFQERRKLAETACAFWQMPIPTLVDTLEPGAGEIYDAWPNRIYVIDKDGKIVCRGPKGPTGVRPREGEAALRKLLGKLEGTFVTQQERSGRSAPP